MKKLLIIPIIFLAAGFFSLTSCGSFTSDSGMKAPIQNNEDTTTHKEKKEKKEKGENEEKEENEKEEKKNKKTSFFKSVKIFNDADTRTMYKTQADLWL